MLAGLLLFTEFGLKSNVKLLIAVLPPKGFTRSSQNFLTTFPDALFQSVIIALHTSDTDVHRPTSIVFSERGCNDA